MTRYKFSNPERLGKDWVIEIRELGRIEGKIAVLRKGSFRVEQVAKMINSLFGDLPEDYVKIKEKEGNWRWNDG